jgi:hypothetical protein
MIVVDASVLANALADDGPDGTGHVPGWVELPPFMLPTWWTSR